MELDEEFGKRLEETKNKAQVTQAHHLAKVLEFLKEPRAGGWAARRECPWEVPVSWQGYRAAAAPAVCVCSREVGEVS